MKVYHGTNVRFSGIDLSKCNPDNDFGKGFYVTAIRQHAEQRAADIYEMKEITMEQLLEKITYREPTHQIMLGAPKAIALIQPDSTFISKTEDIITNMGVALVNDLKMDIIEVMKIIYNSNTFISLTDRATNLYQKPWQEIYEMLKSELKM